jgi:hypothetical protein
LLIPVLPAPLFNLRCDFFTHGIRFSPQIASYEVYTNPY